MNTEERSNGDLFHMESISKDDLRFSVPPCGTVASVPLRSLHSDGIGAALTGNQTTLCARVDGVRVRACVLARSVSASCE